MGRVSVDFGTCNTVIARYNEAAQRAESIEITDITTPYEWQARPGEARHVVHVTPSLIHYAADATLIGKQVSERGLAEHPDTFRWMKRSIAQNNTRVQKTVEGFKSAADAGADFLCKLLGYAGDRISFAKDEFTFTAPVEAFENFQDWLLRITESLGIQRVRLQDEPTACVFGYMGMARREDRFVVFDFGGGTLDVSAVRLELEPDQDPKAVQLGASGEELGGMDIDQWLLEDFCERHGLNGAARGELETVILRQAEDAKIKLSDAAEPDATITVVNKYGDRPRVHTTAYTACCPACAWRRSPCPVVVRKGDLCPGCGFGAQGSCGDTGGACLGCILNRWQFAARVRETVNRALMNAAAKYQMLLEHVTRVLVTGGTSLAPRVRHLLLEIFGDRVFQDRPFDAVARGACQGVVTPHLKHDYSLLVYNRATKQNEFRLLFEKGTEYPTAPEAVRRWVKGAYNGQTRLGLKIHEVSQLKRRGLGQGIVGPGGVLRGGAGVATTNQHVFLNEDNPTFIVADPPVNLERDGQRFLCSFQVNGNRRLLVTVLDNLRGVVLLEDHPVVRL